MNLDKSKKRIAKKSKMGFQGYPVITIIYRGLQTNLADEVIVQFLSDEGASVMEENFQSQSDAREDETIQSAIVKIIERSNAKTVKSSLEVILKNS